MVNEQERRVQRRGGGSYRGVWAAAVLLMGSALLLMGALAPIPGIAEEATPTPSLEARLREALGAKGLEGAKVGLKVVGARDGRVIFDQGGDTPMNPASNLKILTAATALSTLGPAYSFPTLIYTDGDLEDGGIVPGNLYIQGRGDPELVYEEVYKLARELQALGIRKIRGDLVGDDAYFDDVRLIPGWEPGGDDISRAYYAPLGALSFSFNTVSILLSPGKAEGEPGILALETPTDFVTFTNEVKTGARSRGLSVLRTPGGGPGAFTATGTIAVEAKPLRFYRAIGDPTAFALTIFEEQLKAVGITVEGRRRAGTVPPGAVLFHQTSSTSLDVLLKYMNKISSNFIAESVLKALGAERYGAPGTTANGVKVVEAYLREQGLWREGVKIYNGSGLSQKTEVPPALLVDVLLTLLDDPRIGPEFLSSLPIAGVDGTLRSRMRNAQTQGLVRAKTGSIDGVYAMSGYVFREKGETLVFSLIANDTATYRSTARRALEEVIEVLALGDSGG